MEIGLKRLHCNGPLYNSGKGKWQLGASGVDALSNATGPGTGKEHAPEAPIGLLYLTANFAAATCTQVPKMRR